MHPALTLRLLRLFSWPHLAGHRLRTALTVSGVALGVAAVVAIGDVSASVLASFQQMVRTVAGDCELEVQGPAGGIAEEVVERVASVHGVRAAAGIIEAFVPPADGSGEPLYLLGLDFLGSPVWEAQFPRAVIEVPDELEFVARADSVLIPRGLAARKGLELGSELRVVGPAGPRTLHVRGFLGDAPPARLFGGALAVMDLPAAARLLAREGPGARRAGPGAPGARPETVRAAVGAVVGDGLEVAAPEGRGEQADRLLSSFRAMLACMSLSAVIVAGFIVYHTVAVSVRQRQRQFALMNAVGVERPALVWLCLLETLLLASAGVVLGFAAGRQLGRLGAGLVAGTASEIWLRIAVTQEARPWTSLLLSVGVGLGLSLVTAYLAIRATFRAPTVEALRPAGLAADDPPALARALATAVLLLVASWFIVLAPPGLGLVAVVSVIMTSVAMALLGAGVLAPALVAVAGRAVARLARRVRWLPWRLAAENLPRSPGRSGATVATIIGAMGIAVTLVCLVESMEAAWLGWIDQHFASDLFVGGGGRVRLLAGPPMVEEVGDEIARSAGVQSVEPFRVIHIQVEGRPAFLQGLSLADRLAHGGLPMVEGDLAAAAPALEAGTGVLLSDNLAYRLGRHRGDEITLATPAGPRRFRVEGTYVDYLGSLDLGAVAVAQTELARVWGDRFANGFRVWLAPGASAGAVRADILKRFPPTDGYYVLTAREFLDGVRSSISQVFVAAWALELVAALVAVIGVLNAQVATVLDRAREIGTLRTIGVSAEDLTGSVFLECGALGVLGGACGVALGMMQAAQMMYVSLRLMTGWRIPLALPPLPLVAGIVLAAVISALAGYVPARAAARVAGPLRSID